MAMAEERGGRGEQDMKAALQSALLCCVVSTVGLANQVSSHFSLAFSIFSIYHFFNSIYFIYTSMQCNIVKRHGFGSWFNTV